MIGFDILIHLIDRFDTPSEFWTCCLGISWYGGTLVR